MREKWIGEEDNTSGSYFTITELCPELSVRKGRYIHAKKLYTFKCRFGSVYNITEEEVLDNIDGLVTKDESIELYEYIYRVIIERFGAMEFIQQIERKIAEQHDIGYEKGKKHMQKEIRELLGL